MMGLLKEMTQGIQNKPWIPLGKKGPVEAPAAPGKVEKKVKSFCDPEAKLPCLTVCAPKKGCSCDCAGLRDAVEQQIAQRGLKLTVGAAKVGCAGSCTNGPFLGFPQQGFFYLHVRPEDLPLIFEETILRGKILFPYVSINPDRSYRSDIYYEKDSGLLAAIHDKVCMVEVAKYFLDFEEGLSCGKCVPCRVGLKRMYESMERIVTGKGSEEDLDQIRALCDTMRQTPHCDFAQTSSRPVLSAITNFADEFEAHVKRQECPAGVCKDLVEIQRKRAVRERLRKQK